MLDADIGFSDRFATMRYATTFTCLMDPRLRTDFPYILRVTGGGFPPYNALAKIEVATGKHEVFTRPGGTEYKSASCHGNQLPYLVGGPYQNLLHPT
jgi:hypothetical protein